MANSDDTDVGDITAHPVADIRVHSDPIMGTTISIEAAPRMSPSESAPSLLSEPATFESPEEIACSFPIEAMYETKATATACGIALLLVACAIFLQMINWWSVLSHYGSAVAIQSELDSRAIEDSFASIQSTALVQRGLTFIAGLLFILVVYMHRKNLSLFSTTRFEYSPKWCFWGFVVPIWCLWVPFKVISEISLQYDKCISFLLPCEGPDQGQPTQTDDLGKITVRWWVAFVIYSYVAKLFSYAVARSLSEYAASWSYVVIHGIGLFALLQAIIILYALESRNQLMRDCIGEYQEDMIGAPE